VLLIEVGAVVWYVLLVAIIVATAQSTLSGAIANWYFRPVKATEQKFGLTPILLQLLRYNSGSIVLGCILRPVVYIGNWIDYALNSGYSKSERQAGAAGKQTSYDKFSSKLHSIFKTSDRLAYVEVSFLIRCPSTTSRSLNAGD
jgi:hypothetical protein